MHVAVLYGIHAKKKSFVQIILTSKKLFLFHLGFQLCECYMRPYKSRNDASIFIECETPEKRVSGSTMKSICSISIYLSYNETVGPQIYALPSSDAFSSESTRALRCVIDKIDE